MWETALPKLGSGQIDIDPTLASRKDDKRRGITLIAQPGSEVENNVSDILNDLRTSEPEQYFYSRSELHVTVLSLFTATEAFEPFEKKLPAYKQAVERTLNGAAPFKIEFRGITASAGAVLIQGFPSDGMLEAIRARLREELTHIGLGSGLDQRYRLVTAHMTVLRFRAPLKDNRRFTAQLEQARTLSFGRAHVNELSLVKNDWYMSEPTQEWLGRFPLKQRG